MRRESSSRTTGNVLIVGRVDLFDVARESVSQSLCWAGAEIRATHGAVPRHGTSGS